MTADREPEAAAVRCSDCRQDVPLPPGVRSGDVIECPNCAGLVLRVRRANGRWTVRVAPTASCPHCDRVVVLPDRVRAGERLQSCGRQYRLTFEYGAWALEPLTREARGPRAGDRGRSRP